MALDSSQPIKSFCLCFRLFVRSNYVRIKRRCWRNKLSETSPLISKQTNEQSHSVRALEKEEDKAAEIKVNFSSLAPILHLRTNCYSTAITDLFASFYLLSSWLLRESSTKKPLQLSCTFPFLSFSRRLKQQLQEHQLRRLY